MADSITAFPFAVIVRTLVSSPKYEVTSCNKQELAGSKTLL